jgi:signal transduction histidine kinase
MQANLLDNAVKYSPPGTPIEVESYWLRDAAAEVCLLTPRPQRGARGAG